MHKIGYIILIGILLSSCKSNALAQQKETEKPQKTKIEKPKFEDIQDQKSQVDPNTVILAGTILEVKKDATICGKVFKAAVSVKVKRIIGTGPGVVNLISSGQEVMLVFEDALVKDFTSLQQSFIKGKEVTFKVGEDLCPDMTNTRYMIRVYNMQNE